MPSAVTLEELIALNQEIISLSRAGVPLEAGLREIAVDQPARLGELSITLSEHMRRGRSLAEAVASEGDRMPRVYGRVVEAGLRAGRLPAALEALTSFAGVVLDLRRKIGFALLYPLIVAALAYGLFLLFILELARRIHQTYDLIGIPIPPALRFVGSMGESIAYWGWIPPLALIVLVVAWRWTGGVRGLQLLSGRTPLRWIPGVRRITDNLQASNFAALLALMVDHDVPLPEGITLSAESVTDARFTASAREIAASVERGESLHDSVDHCVIPSYLRWLMAAKEQQGDLAGGLRAASAMYRRRADDQSAYLRLLFPLVAAVLIGGGATLVYALTMFLPLTETLRDLALEVAPY